MTFLLLNAHIRFSGDCVVYASLPAATWTASFYRVVGSDSDSDLCQTFLDRTMCPTRPNYPSQEYVRPETSALQDPDLVREIEVLLLLPRLLLLPEEQDLAADFQSFPKDSQPQLEIRPDYPLHFLPLVCLFFHQRVQVF